MDFFSNSRPNLISNRTIKALEKLYSIKGGDTVNEKGVSDTLYNLYKNYIEPNIFLFILLIIFCLFLIYKYISKNQEEFQPTFNPSIPIESQNSYVNYLPDNAALNVGGELKSYNDLVPPKSVPFEYPPIIHPQQNRNVYTGTTNTYLNAQDTRIPHPFDWPMDLNETTDAAVNYMTKKNRKSVDNITNSIINGEYYDQDNNNHNQCDNSQYTIYQDNEYDDMEPIVEKPYL